MHVGVTLGLRLCGCVLLLASLGAQQPPPAGQDGERDFLSRVRRLTLEGRRAGEGYWSKDGSSLVFQSEREPGNPFYQIYTMTLASGEIVRVSPGTGKTTCAFFNPAGDVLFSSTHHNQRSASCRSRSSSFAHPGKERRYSWDYDPEMELYVRRAGTGVLSRLTNARGYDAEGSYSPDGQWIVFSSTRQAYARRCRRPSRNSSRPTRASSLRFTSCARMPTGLRSSG